MATATDERDMENHVALTAEQSREGRSSTAALEAEVARLRALLADSYEEELYSAYHAGLKNPEKNQWRSGGMSDAEWLCRKANLPLNLPHAADALFARIPDIARQMVEETKAVEERNSEGPPQQEQRGSPTALSQPSGRDADPHPRWKPNNGHERHPQTIEEWNYRNDSAGGALDRSIRRLNVAGDYDDPRAPDQMALVLRIDLIRLIGDYTHKRAAFEHFMALFNASKTDSVVAGHCVMLRDNADGAQEIAYAGPLMGAPDTSGMLVLLNPTDFDKLKGIVDRGRH